MTKILQNTRGIAAIEFALVSPLLIALLLGGWDVQSASSAAGGLQFVSQQATVVYAQGGDAATALSWAAS